VVGCRCSNVAISSSQPTSPFHLDWLWLQLHHLDSNCASIPEKAFKSFRPLFHLDMDAISVLSATYPETKTIHLKAFCNHKISHSRGSAQKDDKQYGCFKKITNHNDRACITQSLSRKRLPHIAKELVVGLQSEGFLLNNSTLTALMLYYANNGFLAEADAIWNEIINSSYSLDLHIVSELIDAYIGMGFFDEVIRIIRQISLRHPQLQREVYAHTISCFGKIGELDLMEDTLKDMVSKGFLVDSAIGNAYIVYYSRFGSISMMENAYKRLKSSRILIEKDGIRAISVAYIRDKKFHSLGKFLRDVGLGRRNAGNLLWNLLLLSYAANFKMKSLQREFLNMVEAGFYPDLTTFNIRAVAFSKMSLFWDLHLTLEHMNHNGVIPDLVTYGCVVDAYLDRRLGRNLEFALRKMNVKDPALVSADPIVFEVMGKGEFHSSSEALLEFKRLKTWTYQELIATYLKKKYRSNQVFWNY
ncbi:Pentatricopeptide repeat-containing protein, partial [Cynara cardunculus var. scolymus]